MSTSTAITILGDFVDGVGTVLSTSLPTVLTILAGLVGLGIVLRYVRKWIGRK